MNPDFMAKLVGGTQTVNQLLEVLLTVIDVEKWHPIESGLDAIGTVEAESISHDHICYYEDVIDEGRLHEEAMAAAFEQFVDRAFQSNPNVTTKNKNDFDRVIEVLAEEYRKMVMNQGIYKDILPSSEVAKKSDYKVRRCIRILLVVGNTSISAGDQVVRFTKPFLKITVLDLTPKENPDKMSVRPVRELLRYC